MINPPELTIINRVGERSLVSGLDHPDRCHNKKRFAQYQHNITYDYNSRGFRDDEWPDIFDDVIWCVGDSFTAGVGVPVEHTWPQLLSKHITQRTINVSLDGASNNWIARQVNTIINSYNPKTIVVHWSFISRREKTLTEALDLVWEDYYSKIQERKWPRCRTLEEIKLLPDNVQEKLQPIIDTNIWWANYDIESIRRIQHVNTDLNEDWKNLQSCIHQVSEQQVTKIIHSFIPGWHCGFTTAQEFNFHEHTSIGEVNQVDYGRDGFHYDIKTAEMFAQQISQVLDNSALT
jgi:hypothetical protein